MDCEVYLSSDASKSCFFSSFLLWSSFVCMFPVLQGGVQSPSRTQINQWVSLHRKKKNLWTNKRLFFFPFRANTLRLKLRSVVRIFFVFLAASQTNLFVLVTLSFKWLRWWSWAFLTSEGNWKKNPSRLICNEKNNHSWRACFSLIYSIMI